MTDIGTSPFAERELESRFNREAMRSNSSGLVASTSKMKWITFNIDTKPQRLTWDVKSLVVRTLVTISFGPVSIFLWHL